MLLRTQKNKIFLYGTLYAGDAVLFDEKFSALQASESDIELHLHTCGGNVFEGNMIYNRLLSASSSVSVHIDGLAASMGAIIMLGGEKIYMAENAFLMIHAPSGQTFGTASDHMKAANLLTEMEDIFVKRFSQRTGKTESEVKKWLEGDNWFSAAQALKEGLIDEITPPAIKVEIQEKDLSNPQGVFDRFAALLERSETFKEKLNQPEFSIMKEKMIEAFGLELQKNSSETAFIAALEERINRYKDLYESEKLHREKLEHDIEQQEKDKVTALLDRARKEGKISAPQEALYKEVGQKNGAATLERLFEIMPDRRPLSAQVKLEAAQDRYEWDWDRYQKEDPVALERMKVEDPKSFKALYEAKYKK